MDLVPPEFAWYERSGDDAVIGCQYRNMTWSLHCDGNRWNGVVGKCNDTSEDCLQNQLPYYHIEMNISNAAQIVLINRIFVVS